MRPKSGALQRLKIRINPLTVPEEQSILNCRMDRIPIPTIPISITHIEKGCRSAAKRISEMEARKVAVEAVE
jgi:hypothetical protein